MHEFCPTYLNKHAGEVGIVLGNGPSVNDYDLSHPFFTKNITIGSNAIGKIFSPSYYFVGDPGAYEMFGNYVFNGDSVPCIGGHILRDIRRVHQVMPYLVVRYKYSDRVGLPSPGIIYHGRTSGIVMLHMAFQLGLKYVFMLGIDGYGVPGESHFYPDSAGRATSDDIVEIALGYLVKGFMESGRYFYDLSARSVFTVVPKYHELARSDEDILKKLVDGKSSAAKL